MKNCYHCLNIRPQKNNICIVNKTKIENIHEHSCEIFKEDWWITKLENEQKFPDVKNQGIFLFHIVKVIYMETKTKNNNFLFHN